MATMPGITATAGKSTCSTAPSTATGSTRRVRMCRGSSEFLPRNMQLHVEALHEVTAEAVKELRTLPALEILRVPVATTDDGLKHLAAAFPNLKALILQESKVTNAGLRPLARLKHLTRLNLTATSISDDCWKELAA